MNKRIKLVIALSFLGIACSTATTPETTHPPGDDDDAGTAVHSGSDAGASSALSCPDVFTGNAACQACLANSCANECDACGTDASCRAALICVVGCDGSEGCNDACVAEIADSSNDLLDATESCVTTTCASACKSPATAQIGDPCSTDAQCFSGVCNDTWCEPALGCTNNVDCGINTDGSLVWCVESSSNLDTCFPGCSSSADCDDFPGTTCKLAIATNGVGTDICSF